MDEERRKAIFKETFDTVAAGYDGGALRFFSLIAGHMASLLELRGDEHILDVACGTGHLTTALAVRLPRGRVIAVDFSPGMLEQRGRKRLPSILRTAISPSKTGLRSFSRNMPSMLQYAPSAYSLPTIWTSSLRGSHRS